MGSLLGQAFVPNRTPPPGPPSPPTSSSSSLLAVSPFPRRRYPSGDFSLQSRGRRMAVRCSVITGSGGNGDSALGGGVIPRSFQCLDGIKTLSQTGRYKAWLLDQFGVLHDGKNPYPGAISALEKLADNGAKLVIISNSSRRACTTTEKLKGLGFDSSLIFGAITSGELTHQYLLRRDDPWIAALGRSCIHITWSDRGAISLEGLGLQVVDNVDDANFILAHGTEAIGLPSGDLQPMNLEDLERILEMSVKRNLPMIVANPDFVTVEARALRVMPGTLASKYEKLGGEVRWMGKPYEAIYEAAIALAGVDAVNCIAVGDSLHHDIKGANKAGIASVFVTGGIHADELGLGSLAETAEATAVESLTAKFDAYPSYVLPAFTW